MGEQLHVGVCMCVHVAAWEGMGLGGCFVFLHGYVGVGGCVCVFGCTYMYICVCQVQEIFPSMNTVDEHHRLLYCIHFNTFSTHCPHKVGLFLSNFNICLKSSDSLTVTLIVYKFIYS